MPLMAFLHIGQVFNAGEHLRQETKCPHGNRTIETSSSMQICNEKKDKLIRSSCNCNCNNQLSWRQSITLHNFCSLSLKFSSSSIFVSALLEFVSWFSETLQPIESSIFFSSSLSSVAIGLGKEFFFSPVFCLLLWLHDYKK